MGKITHESRKEIAQIMKHTENLKTKFDDLANASMYWRKIIWPYNTQFLNRRA